jgi:hypothetical protein
MRVKKIFKRQFIENEELVHRERYFWNLQVVLLGR